MSDQINEISRLYELYIQDSNVAHLEAIFHLMDKDNSGEITKQEAADLIRPLAQGETDSLAAQFIAEGDKDGDQKINLAEFIAGLTQ